MKISKETLCKICEDLKWTVLDSVKDDKIVVDDAYEALELIYALENGENLEVTDNA